METFNQQSNPQPSEKSIFNEEDLLSGDCTRHVKNARNTIFIVAATQLIFGTALFFINNKSYNVESAVINLGVVAFISLIFFTLGLWAKGNPYTAILCALIFYLLLLLSDVFYEPSYILKGIIIKIFIIIYLIRGVKNAYAVKQWKDAFGK